MKSSLTCDIINLQTIGGFMKYVLVTGAYGGMGYQTIQKFKQSGFTVFALDKTVLPAEENIIPIKVDLTDPDSITTAFQTVKSITPKLEGIIHFAGIYMLNSLVEISEQDFEKIFKINLFGVYRINKTFLPLLARGSKIIITTSELAPLLPLPFTGIYAITKSALDNYAHSLRMELQLLDISVSVIRAGAVKTQLLNVSTTALDQFCSNTKLYSCNATRFKKIVDSVEAKNIPPEKIALKAYKIFTKKNPKMAYSINPNSLLKLLNILPKHWQFAIIRKILK